MGDVKTICFMGDWEAGVLLHPDTNGLIGNLYHPALFDMTSNARTGEVPKFPYKQTEFILCDGCAGGVTNCCEISCFVGGCRGEAISRYVHLASPERLTTLKSQRHIRHSREMQTTGAHVCNAARIGSRHFQFIPLLSDILLRYFKIENSYRHNFRRESTAHLWKAPSCAVCSGGPSS